MIIFDHIKGDIYPTRLGQEVCKPGHSYGPAVRDHFLIHYIAKGRGTFHTGGREYFLESGQGFLITPDILTYYAADDRDPWHYYWIGFKGGGAARLLAHVGLDTDHPVFNCRDHKRLLACFSSMFSADVKKRGGDLHLLGDMYHFFAILAAQNQTSIRSTDLENPADRYVRQSAEYIKNNYSQRITVDEIAAHVGLNRSYLSTLFKRETGISLQQYIIDFRIRRAAALLLSTDLSVGDIARSVGYEDPLLFSKIFKNQKGLSPRNYKKVYQTSQDPCL